MNASGVGRNLGALLVGAYAWATAVSFGLAWLDSMYARLVPEARGAFSDVADLLLLVSAATVLVALGAIGLSWRSTVARNFLISSLIATGLGFLAPAFLAPFLGQGSAVGPVIRLSLGSLVSVLAFLGFHAYLRER